MALSALNASSASYKGSNPRPATCCHCQGLLQLHCKSNQINKVAHKSPNTERAADEHLHHWQVHFDMAVNDSTPMQAMQPYTKNNDIITTTTPHNHHHHHQQHHHHNHHHHHMHIHITLGTCCTDMLHWGLIKFSIRYYSSQTRVFQIY